MAKKNIARRSLAMVMAMIMCLSLFQITAFASDGPAAITYPEVTIASNGETTSVVGSNGISVSGSKILTKTGDNTFDVTLNVQTVSTSETAFTANPAHVVLVIDRSGSMGEDYGNAIVDARAAAKSFAGIFLGEKASDDNRLAVVSYASNVKTDCELVGKDGLSGLTCDDGIIDGIDAGGGTLTQGGIYTAQQILANGHQDGVKDIIVLLSDGAPTYSYQLTGTATISCNGRSGYRHGFGDSYSNIQFTGRNTSNILGNGQNFYDYYYSRFLDEWVYEDNCILNCTCSHNKTIFRSVKTDGNKILDLANNGTATVWEAGQAKAASTEIYSVLLTSAFSDGDADTTMRGVATDTEHYLSGNADAVASLFQQIANTVVTPAGGNILTDPMSQYVTLGKVTVPAAPKVGEIDKTGGNQISWDLSKATPVSTTEKEGKTTNTYKLTYQITVNRSKAFYDAILANDAVPTNGTTALACTLGGESKSLTFLVPTVTSDMPTVPYTINYYKQGTDGTYSETHSQGSALYGGTFQGQSKDYGEGYFFDTGKSNVAGPATPKAVSLNTADNVINIYYSLPSYTVTVKHMLQTKTLDAYGNSTGEPVETLLPPVETVTVYYGGSFDANDKIRTPGEHDSWTYDEALTQKANQLSLSNITEKKDLTIWYSAVVDGRMTIPYTVTHHVTTHSWAYNNSTKKWEDNPNTQGYDGNSGNGKYGTNSEAVEPLEEYASHLTRVEIDGVTQSDNNTVVALTNPNGHKIDLYYDVPATNEPQKASYWYLHHYKLITSTGSGKTENTVGVPGARVNGHVGDVITTTESDAVLSHDGVDYDLTTKVPFYTTLTAGENANVIDLYYTKDTTVGVDVSVIYHYEVYNQKVNPADGTLYFNTDPDATPESQEETIPMLAGNLFTLTPNDAYVHHHAGNYTVDTTRTDTPVNVSLESGTTYTYNVYCVQKNYVDQNQEGSVTVNFNYYTLKTYYDENGDLQENFAVLDNENDPVSQTFHGVLGDTFTKALSTSYKGNSDYALAAGDTTSDPVTATIVDTDGSEVNVNFYRSVDLRTETTVTVTPVFVTRTAHATADKSVFTYTEDSHDGTPVTYPLTGKLYAGQKWSVVPESSLDGFTFDSERTTAANAYENVLLGSSENPTNIKLYYVKPDESALEPVTVIVRHYRTTKVFDVNSETLVPGTPVKDAMDDEYSGYYVGNSFSTENTSKANGFDIVESSRPAATYSITADNVQTVQLDGKDTKVLYVDWYYTQDSYPQTVNVIVNYKVTVKEYATGAVVGKPVEISGEATPYTKRVGTLFNTPNYQSYTDGQIDGIVLNGEKTDSKSFRVSASGDTVTLEYVIYQDSRQDATVLVQHNYFDLDTYTGVETPASEKTHTVEVKTVRNESGLITNDIYVGETYTAAIDGDTGDYTCRTAAEALTAVLDAPETHMTVEYVKTTSSDPGSAAYLVRHDYYVNGQFEDSVNGIGGTGKVGSTVSGADVAPVLLHNGQAYTQTGATGSITLSKEGDNLIVLTYNRTEQVTPPAPPEPPTPPVDDNYHEEDNTTPVAIPEGPTPLAPTPLSPTPGTTTDIPDGDVPQTEIPDEETPLAATPAKTGDNLILWILAAGVSGIGLVWVSLLGRKRRDGDGSQN